ncbi:VWA domain-containing protein [Pelagicoccus sp. SDUM812003]|uniref:VWA domain-containing protein n=1 Tax=Pelagicoccus sp. SDUM812003 TaxID=3041267 RepID=UPI00280E2592|nr:VWA domain-containing protein [Pelagicoccus sp. SDUM812003]MDQ8203079.1 VWA domain-containing protein [Pelagicoccus sp. SDUM812003]
MSWGSEHWLWGLALPPLVLLWDLFRHSRSASKSKHGKALYANTAFGGLQLSKRRHSRPRKVLLCLALSLLVVSMAQPRWGSEKRTTFERSREVIIAMDLSKSMLAEDLKPNRLERAKLVVSSMLDTLNGESVGLLVFAGTSFLQSPMSPDYQILRSFLKDLNPDFIPQGGTDYAAMLETALESFEQSDGRADRFLIVISDGESLESNWQAAAEKLREENVQAICLGFGTQEGGFIPDGSGGFHKDPQGAVVLSKLERSTLVELARITGGVYREANVWIDLAQLVEDTVKKGQARLKEREREESEIERYHYFLAPGLALLLLSIYYEFPTMPRARNLKGKAAA